jgi:hypothetical protein
MVRGSVPREVRTEVLYNFINIIVYNLDESGQPARRYQIYVTIMSPKLPNLKFSIYDQLISLAACSNSPLPITFFNSQRSGLSPGYLIKKDELAQPGKFLRSIF